MTSRFQLRDITAKTLIGATAAGGEVYTPSDWPTWSQSKYPVLIVSAPGQNDESLGRGTVQFTTTATIRVVAKVQVLAATRDQGALEAEVELERIETQIRQTMFNAPAIRRLVQQWAAVRAEMAVSSDGEQHIGELRLEADLEYYTGPEDLFPVQAVPLAEIDVHADLVNRFDPSGTYEDPPFPDSVLPAPRTEGPDGRDEGAVKVVFPPNP